MGSQPRLIAGAALFGLGWGTAGYCPGPALVSLVGLTSGALTFCASMVAGIAVFHALAAARRERADDGNSTTI